MKGQVRNRKNKQLKTTVENEWNYNMNKTEGTKEIKTQTEKLKRRTNTKEQIKGGANERVNETRV